MAMNPEILSILNALFGGRVRATDHAIRCDIDLTGLPLDDGEIRTIFREKYAVEPVGIRHQGPKTIAYAPYALLYQAAKTIFEDGPYLQSNSIAARLLHHFYRQSDITRVRIPCGEAELPAAELASMLEAQFRFIEPLRVEPSEVADGDELVVTLSQFQTLHNAWQSQVELSDTEKLLLSRLDNRPTRQAGPHGSAQARRADEDADDPIADMAEQMLDLLGGLGATREKDAVEPPSPPPAPEKPGPSIEGDNVIEVDFAARRKR